MMISLACACTGGLRRLAVRLVSLLVVVVFAGAVAESAFAIDGFGFVYDSNGRLVNAIDPANPGSLGLVTWAYDANGNITSIARGNAATIRILSVKPARAAIGSTVAISGTGFSATVAQDVAKFNGTTATVTSASRTRLLVTVPAGATTGLITVKVGAAAAVSSPLTFTVGLPAGPAVTSVSATKLIGGQSFTVIGTAFDTDPKRDVVALGLLRGRVTAATATSLTVTLPGGTDNGARAWSGRVSVSTPNGATTGTQDVFVAPSGNVAADIGVSARAAIGTTSTVTVPAAKLGQVVFDGTQGQRVFVRFSNASGAARTAYLVDPYGQTIATGASPSGGNTSTLSTTTLATSGPYTLQFASDPAASTFDLLVSSVPDDIVAPLTFGTPKTVALSTPGRRRTT